LGSEVFSFYAFALLAVTASALVIGQRNPIHSVLLLIASFGALSGLYLTLDAPFVAVIQIVIYAGAIMVLFLFVVMLLNEPREDTDEDRRIRIPARPWPLRIGAVLALLLGVELLWAVGRTLGLGAAVSAGDTPTTVATVKSVREIGLLLFTEYAFAFEVTSVLILVGLVGAVVLARRESPATTTDNAQ